MNSKNPYLSSSVLTPAGIVVILLGYLAESLRMSWIVKDGLPSESFFPVIIFLLGFPIAVYLLAGGLKEAKKNSASLPEEAPCEQTETEEKEAGVIKVAHKPVYITILTFAFVFLFKYLGYSITAPLYVFAFQLIYDDKMEHLAKKAVTSVVIALLVYGLYVGVFNIMFPEVWK
jgi:hypothetical protein